MIFGRAVSSRFFRNYSFELPRPFKGLCGLDEAGEASNVQDRPRAVGDRVTQEMKSCEAVLKARCKGLPLWSYFQGDAAFLGSFAEWYAIYKPYYRWVSENGPALE